MKQTDEEIAKKYAEGIVKQNSKIYDKHSMDVHQFSGNDLMESFFDGLQKGREQSDEKSMRFAEWTNMKGWTYNYMVKKWYNTILHKTALTEELYSSEGFKDYLKQFEK